MDEKSSMTEIEKYMEDFDQGDFMGKTLPLNHDDYSLIGALLQAYCWADFNGRRVIDLLWAINGTGGGKKASSLRDADVIRTLGVEAKNLNVLSNLSDGLLRVFDMLNMHKDRRNEVAHWAARRLVEFDAILVLSKNKRENDRRGIDINGEGDFVGFGVMPIQELRTECDKLFSHNEYLAAAVASLSEYLSLVRAGASGESS